MRNPRTHTHAHTRSCYQNGECRTCSLCHNRRGILCLGVNVHLLLLPLPASSLLAASACCMWSIGVVFPTFRVGHVYGHLFMEFGYCMHLLLLLMSLLLPSSLLCFTRTMDSLHVISPAPLPRPSRLACVRFLTAMCVQDMS